GGGGLATALGAAFAVPAARPDGVPTLAACPGGRLLDRGVRLPVAIRLGFRAELVGGLLGEVGLVVPSLGASAAPPDPATAGLGGGAVEVLGRRRPRGGEGLAFRRLGLGFRLGLGPTAPGAAGGQVGLV